jgi:hypothetical protein
MIPNLAVDHLSPIPLARVADVQTAIRARWDDYWLAGREIGLTKSERQDLLFRLADDDVTFAVLPRHIDAMAGRKRNGHVYVLRHVVIPALTLGWVVSLRDGTTVYIPQVCGNLSLSRSFPVAHRRSKAAAAPRNVSYRGYFTPVVFTPVPFSAPAGSSSVLHFTEAPVPSTPPVVSATTGTHWGWFAPLWPIAASFFSGGGGVSAPPCSAGSNATGACQR